MLNFNVVRERYGYLLVIIFFVTIFFTATNVTFAESEWDATDIPLDKVWTIKFSDIVERNSVTKSTVKIVSNLNEEFPVELKVNNYEVSVTPIQNYEPNTKYSLIVDGVTSSSGVNLNKSVTMVFNTVNKVVNMRWDAGVAESFWGYYSGEILNGFPHGQGKWIGDEVGRSYIGTYNNGKFHGTGIYRWADGAVFDGEFNNGELLIGTYKFPSGEVYSGEFKDKLYHGKGTINYSNGDFYTGDFIKGNRHGRGTYKWSDGDTYVGEFKDDTMGGYGTYTWSSGESYYGLFKDGEIVENNNVNNGNQEKYEKCLKNNLELLNGGLLNGTTLPDCSIYLK